MFKVSGERSVNRWYADQNKRVEIRIIEEIGIVAKLKGWTRGTRTVEVPYEVVSNLLEPAPLIVRANQRVEISQDGVVVQRG